MASCAIHTDAIKENIIPTLSEAQKRYAYPQEADLLNVALFGKMAKEWREENPDLAKHSNMRDNADLLQLTILNNLENINAELIKEGLSKADRPIRLNESAKRQVKLLSKTQYHQN